MPRCGAPRARGRAPARAWPRRSCRTRRAAGRRPTPAQSFLAASIRSGTSSALASQRMKCARPRTTCARVLPGGTPRLHVLRAVRRASVVVLVAGGGLLRGDFGRGVCLALLGSAGGPDHLLALLSEIDEPHALRVAPDERDLGDAGADDHALVGDDHHL